MRDSKTLSIVDVSMDADERSDAAALASARARAILWGVRKDELDDSVHNGQDHCHGDRAKTCPSAAVAPGDDTHGVFSAPSSLCHRASSLRCQGSTYDYLGAITPPVGEYTYLTQGAWILLAILLVLRLRTPRSSRPERKFRSAPYYKRVIAKDRQE